MKTYHWFLLGFGFMIIAMVFISMDAIDPMSCDPHMKASIEQASEIYGRYSNGEITEEEMNGLMKGVNTETDPLDIADIWCVMNAEMFDPFIWAFSGLGYMFLAIGFIDTFINKKQKKK
jgi:hypothetical protein